MTEPAPVHPLEAPLDEALFVYAVVDAAAALPDDVVGLDDAPLRLVPHGQVAAVVAGVTVERPPGRRVDLLAYNGVLDALAERTAVIPVRFGSLLPDETGVIDELLAPRAEELAVMLGELRGCSQFTFQASYLEPVVLSEIVAANPEIADLRRRTRGLPEDVRYGERVRLGELVARAVEQKQSVDAHVLLDVVLPHTVAHMIRPVSGLERLLDVSLLVEAERQDEFEKALEALAEGVHERMRLRLMGPMAPYDFVGDV